MKTEKNVVDVTKMTMKTKKNVTDVTEMTMRKKTKSDAGDITVTTMMMTRSVVASIVTERCSVAVVVGMSA